MTTQSKQAAAAASFAIPNEAHALEVSTTYALSEPALQTPARMGRYARVQLRDYLARQGVMMAVLAFVIAVPMALVGMQRPDVKWSEILAVIFSVVATPLIGLGTLVSIRGIVADDTQHGFHRFLFSKPLNVERYYAQLFGVRFIGFMATLAALLLPFMLFGAVPMLQMLGVAALAYVLFGGVGFLLSVLSRLDALLLVVIAGFTTLVQGISRDPDFRWLRALALILPPLDKFWEIVAYLIHNGPGVQATFPVGNAVWVVAYGLASVAAGLALIRRRAVSA